MVTDKHRGSREDYPLLVGKSTEELRDLKLRKEMSKIIETMDIERLKALKALLR